MKGRLTKIVEGRATLIAHLRERFDQHAHLIPEFLRENSLDLQNERWSKLSKAEVGKLFEKYIAPYAASDSTNTNSQVGDLKELSTIRHRIEWIEKELQAGMNKAALQQQLKSEVLQPLEKLNRSWLQALDS